MNNLKMLFDGLAAVGAVYCLAALIRMVGGDVMLHPVIAKGIRFLLIVSGCIFAFLMAMTVAGLVLIELNGGVV